MRPLRSIWESAAMASGILGRIIEVVSGLPYDLLDRPEEGLIRIFLEQVFGSGNELDIFMAMAAVISQ
jgi:hypothetical protein